MKLSTLAALVIFAALSFCIIQLYMEEAQHPGYTAEQSRGLDRAAVEMEAIR